MTDLFGIFQRESQRNGVLVSSYDARLRDESEALREWGIAHYAGAWFRPSPDRMTTFKSGPYRTSEEADAATVKWLEESGYTKPRWWQWWRWDEPKYDEKARPA